MEGALTLLQLGDIMCSALTALTLYPSYARLEELRSHHCDPGHSYVCRTWIETAEKCRKKYFPNRFTLEREKSQLLRDLVDIVWTCSHVGPQKAHEKGLAVNLA